MEREDSTGSQNTVVLQITVKTLPLCTVKTLKAHYYLSKVLFKNAQYLYKLFHHLPESTFQTKHTHTQPGTPNPVNTRLHSPMLNKRLQLHEQ